MWRPCRRAALHAATSPCGRIDQTSQSWPSVNQIKRFAEAISSLPRVKRSRDSTDDFLLALSEAGNADYLVTGDKAGLLALDRHKNTRIISASEFAAML